MKFDFTPLKQSNFHGPSIGDCIHEVPLYVLFTKVLVCSLEKFENQLPTPRNIVIVTTLNQSIMV